jgi:CBS domain-containing protein
VTQRIRDIMQTTVVAVAPSDPLTAVMRLLADEGIHGAPVVDDQRRIVGVISASDLVREAADATAAARPVQGYFAEGVEEFPEGLGAMIRDDDRRVEDVMTESVLRVSPDTPVAEAARLLREHRVHRALVTEGDELVGIVSSFDLIGLLESAEAGASQA